MSVAVHSDLIVIGRGPAGAATAITACQQGLRVTIIEREPSARARPGEAVHPGIEPLLARLEVRDAVLAAGFLRYPGHWVTWGATPRRFVAFGEDQQGPWQGFQLWRPTFDAILLDAAKKQGARLLRASSVQPLVRDGRVVGTRTADGELHAPFVVDATGRQRWLARHCGFGSEQAGPPMIAWFGYAAGAAAGGDDAPAITSDGGGWTWTARVRPGVYQWVRVSNNRVRPPRKWLPDALSGLIPIEGPRGIDVTWSRVRQAAGQGYFLTGDAAFVVDPASSHGLLKAIMSGMMAAHRAAAVLRGEIAADAAAQDYDGWLRQWFRHDVAELRKHYAGIGSPSQTQEPPERFSGGSWALA